MDGVSDKYIYLDWQVFKYCITPRQDKHQSTDNDFSLLIQKLKEKYRIPYSEGHIRDRANRYTPENRKNVELDFESAEALNEQFCLGTSNDGRLVMRKKPMLSFFDEILNKNDLAFAVEPLNFHDFQVDMEKINRSHPLYPLLLQTNGILNSNYLSSYLENVFRIIPTDNDLYKNLRTETSRLNSSDLRNNQNPFDMKSHLDRLLNSMSPMIDALKYDRSQLVSAWPSIANRWFENSGIQQPFPKDLLLIQGYSLLDFHPLFNDKLKKRKNTADNIWRDGIHCYYASEASYYVTEDEKTREKTKLLYDAYGIKTKVVDMAGFLCYFT